MQQTILTLCVLRDVAYFFPSADFFPIFSSKLFEETIKVSTSLDPDQAHRYVDIDLDPNFWSLQRVYVSAGDSGRKAILSWSREA